MTIPCRLGWNQLYGTDTCFAVFRVVGFPKGFLHGEESPLSFDQAREDCLNRSSDLIRVDSNSANEQVFENKYTHKKTRKFINRVFHCK